MPYRNTALKFEKPLSSGHKVDYSVLASNNNYTSPVNTLWKGGLPKLEDSGLNLTVLIYPTPVIYIFLKTVIGLRSGMGKETGGVAETAPGNDTYHGKGVYSSECVRLNLNRIVLSASITAIPLPVSLSRDFSPARQTSQRVHFRPRFLLWLVKLAALPQGSAITRFRGL